MRLTWIIFMFYLHTTELKKSINTSTDNIRERRQVNGLPLVFPYGATYKLLIGYSVPVPNKDHINFAFVGNFQYQYLQFQNISQLSQYYFIKEVSRKEREVIRMKRNERLAFYKALAGLLNTQGAHGQECMLRAICEAAQYPVEEEGLFGELMHILLTPDYGHTEFEDEDLEFKESTALYKDAAIAGRQMFDCPSIYNCPVGQSILDLVTKLREH